MIHQHGLMEHIENNEENTDLTIVTKRISQYGSLTRHSLTFSSIHTLIEILLEQEIMKDELTEFDDIYSFKSMILENIKVFNVIILDKSKLLLLDYIKLVERKWKVTDSTSTFRIKYHEILKELWKECFTSIENHSIINSESLENYLELYKTAFSSSTKDSIKIAVDSWNKTFGKQKKINYPQQLKPYLKALYNNGSIELTKTNEKDLKGVKEYKMILEKDDIVSPILKPVLTTRMKQPMIENKEQLNQKRIPEEMKKIPGDVTPVNKKPLMKKVGTGSIPSKNSQEIEYISKIKEKENDSTTSYTTQTFFSPASILRRPKETPTSSSKRRKTVTFSMDQGESQVESLFSEPKSSPIPSQKVVQIEKGSTVNVQTIIEGLSEEGIDQMKER
jgi:hypothetical protein